MISLFMTLTFAGGSGSRCGVPLPAPRRKRRHGVAGGVIKALTARSSVEVRGGDSAHQYLARGRMRSVAVIGRCLPKAGA